MTVGSTDLGTLELGRGVSELKRRGGQVRANKKSGAGRGRRSARRRESDGARSELQRRAAREFEDQQMEGGETACTAGELLLDGVNYGEVRTLLETCIRINRMSATSLLTAPPARALARLGRTHLTRGVICTCVSSAARRDGSRTADGGLR